MRQIPQYFNFARDVVDRWAVARSSGLALWWVDDSGRERKVTFEQMAQASRRTAHVFHQLGIERGDRVLVVLPRVVEWWFTMLGLIRMGAIPIPGTPLLTTRDIKYRLETAQAKAVMTDIAGAQKVDETGINILRMIDAGMRPGWTDLAGGLEDADPGFEPPPTRADDPGLIYFTSGTTGEPKMVLHTQASYGLGHRLTGELWLDCKPEDVHWNLSDNGWAKAAWSSLFGPWHMGACVFTTHSTRKFEPVSALHTLANYPITTWCAPPTALRLIVREDLSAFKFPLLRHCVSAGEPLNPEVIVQWKRATGLTIFEGYGQTESVIMIGNFANSGKPIKPGSMGQVTPGFDIELLDADLNPVAAGAEGEIAVRIKPDRPLGLFKEYWKNPPENAVRFKGDWYLTGDMARRDEDGYFWFIGRADDVMKSSGYRIGPFEVESALVEHPAVVEAAAVAKPDELRGQIVKAFVVLRRGTAPNDELKTELQEHCKKLTAPYKYPREIEFVADLPKTISGKIRRVQLRDHGAAHHDQTDGR